MQDFLETLESEYPGVGVQTLFKRGFGNGAFFAESRQECYGTPQFWRRVGIQCADRPIWSGSALIKHLMFAKRYSEVEILARRGLGRLADDFIQTIEDAFDFDPEQGDVEDLD